LRGIDIASDETLFFLAAAFFAFHLLLAYLWITSRFTLALAIASSRVEFRLVASLSAAWW